MRSDGYSWMMRLNGFPSVFSSGLFGLFLISAGTDPECSTGNNTRGKEFFSMVGAGRGDVVRGGRVVLAGCVLLQTGLPVKAHSGTTCIVDKGLGESEDDASAYFNAVGDVDGSE